MPPFLLKAIEGAKQWMWVGVAVLFLALTIVSVYYRHRATVVTQERDKLRDNLALAQSTNDANIAVIKELERQKQIDASITKSLMEKMDKLVASDREVRKNLSYLEKTNVDVRTYLAVPVPGPLRRLLSEAVNTSGAGQDDPSASTTPAVSTPETR